MKIHHSTDVAPLTADEIRAYDERMYAIRTTPSLDNIALGPATLRAAAERFVASEAVQAFYGNIDATDAELREVLSDVQRSLEPAYAAIQLDGNVKPSRLTRSVPKENKLGVGLGYEHHDSKAKRAHSGKLSIPEKGGSIYLHTDTKENKGEVRTVRDIEIVLYNAFIAHCQSAINAGVFHFNHDGAYDLTVVPAFRSQGAYQPRLAREAFKAVLEGDTTKPGALEIAVGFGLLQATDIIGSQVPSYLDIGLETASTEARSNWAFDNKYCVSLESVCADVGTDGENVFTVKGKKSHDNPLESEQYQEDLIPMMEKAAEGFSRQR